MWTIIDDPKSDQKEKLKAASLIVEFSDKRFNLIDSESLIKDFFNREEKVKSDKEANTIREDEISRREKSLERALEDHLKNQKLIGREIDEIRARSPVF
jgi:hypothetical protein